MQGTVVRKKENPFHDMDFVAVGHTQQSVEKVLADNFHNFIKTNQIGKSDEAHTLTYLILDRPFNITGEEGSHQPRTITDATTGEQLGWVQNSDLHLNNGVQGKMLDFFMNSDNGQRAVNITVNGETYKVASANGAMKAKIGYNREKI